MISIGNSYIPIDIRSVTAAVRLRLRSSRDDVRVEMNGLYIQVKLLVGAGHSAYRYSAGQTSLRD